MVSVAQRGGLKVVNSPVDLLTTLNESSAIHGKKKSQPSWTRHITTHWRLKVLALSMSIIAWFVLAYDPTTVARTFEVSIDYGNLPPGLVLEQSESHAQLTLSGRKANFRYVTDESLNFSVDLSGFESGSHSVILGKDNIKLPANLEIDSIDPNVLWLELREQPQAEPPD